MRASVISRFAKIVTPAAAVADTSWVRRLAATVPLAAVLMTGAVACGPTGAAHAPATGGAGSPSVAVPGAGVSPVATPSAAPSTSSTPGVQTDPGAPSAAPSSPSAAPSSPSAAPSRSAAPYKASAAAAGDTNPAQEVAISFHGLAGTELPVAGTAPTTNGFTVTWTNTSGHRIDAVAPVVAAQHYQGARCRQTSEVQGNLQRLDGSHWTDLPLSQGTGMDYAYTGDPVAFALAPGASRTISYRLGLGADNAPGTLDIEADAVRPVSADSHPFLTRAVQPVTVADAHRPTAAMPTMTPRPTSVAVGGPAAEVQVEAGNFTGAPMGWLKPRLLLADPAGLLRAQDVTVEVMANGNWTKLPVSEDCDGITADASAVQVLSAPSGRVFEYEFRFALAPTTAQGIGKLTVAAGAIGDGHYAAPVSTEVSVTR